MRAGIEIENEVNCVHRVNLSHQKFITCDISILVFLFFLLLVSVSMLSSPLIILVLVKSEPKSCSQTTEKTYHLEHTRQIDELFPRR